MLLRRSRPYIVIAVALAATISGCGAKDPTPQADPIPRYSNIPEDLCERIPFEKIFEQHGLVVAPTHEQTSQFQTEPTFQYGRCSFVTTTRDGRFATELGEFMPAGSVQVRAYHDNEAALRSYEQDADNLDLQIETVPGTTTSDITGWWGKDGKSAETTQAIDSSGSTIDHISANKISVTHIVRHENLVLTVWGSANVSTSETGEAFTLLRDLTSALIDESVTHLDN